MKFNKKGGADYLCGGSLISSKFVVTGKFI
jgi:hypothetical protein